MAVVAILAALVVSIGWLLVREQRLGRFAPVSTDGVDAEWIEKNIVVHPAEVVGAAWDHDVDKDEVVALISRLVNERKLSGSVGSTSRSLNLQLQAGRESFRGTSERSWTDCFLTAARARAPKR